MTRKQYQWWSGMVETLERKIDYLTDHCEMLKASMEAAIKDGIKAWETVDQLKDQLETMTRHCEEAQKRYAMVSDFCSKMQEVNSKLKVENTILKNRLGE